MIHDVTPLSQDFILPRLVPGSTRLVYPIDPSIAGWDPVIQDSRERRLIFIQVSLSHLLDHHPIDHDRQFGEMEDRIMDTFLQLNSHFYLHLI